MDLSNIHFEKIKLLYEPDPNVAEPSAKVLGHNVLLKYYTDDKIGFTAEILFQECLMFRIGSPNDEGFYISKSPTGVGGGDHGMMNGSIYCKGNFPDLEYHSFYKVSGFDWKTKKLIGQELVILDNDFPIKDGYNHYVFFMKDGTFECIAKAFEMIN